MKEITLQVYLEALNKVDPRTQELMRSEKLYEVISNLLKSKAEPVNPELLVLPIGYHLLNLLSLEEILLELTNFGVSDQFNFLSTIKKTLSNYEAEVQTEIPPGEDTLPSLEPVRTMTSDQKANLPQTEAVYPSQQDTILTNKNIAPTTNPPKWGSES